MEGLIEATERVKESAMTHKEMQVLIVATDSRSVAHVASEIVTQLDANITIVDSIDEARVLVASEAYDVVLTSRVLDDGSGTALIKPFGIPVVLVDDQTDPRSAVEAFRAGAADVVCHREDATAIARSIGRVVQANRKQRHTLSRNRRLRRVSSRLIKDRRELRQRVDLICRDLVQAYQRLAEKVVAGSDGFGERA